MRTIPEVVEDIKSILNNVECTEECTGETLVDINELADEILSINSIGKGKLSLSLPFKIGSIIWHYEKGMKEPIPHQIKEMIISEEYLDRIEIKFTAFSGFIVCDFMGHLDEGWYLTEQVQNLVH